MHSLLRPIEGALTEYDCCSDILVEIKFPVLQQIKKDLKKYSKIFEQKDRLSQSKASKARHFWNIIM